MLEPKAFIESQKRATSRRCRRQFVITEIRICCHIVAKFFLISLYEVVFNPQFSHINFHPREWNHSLITSFEFVIQFQMLNILIHLFANHLWLRIFIYVHVTFPTALLLQLYSISILVKIVTAAPKYWIFYTLFLYFNFVWISKYQFSKDI